MLVKKLRDTALATAAAGALMIGMGVGSANAASILDDWNLNLSVVNGLIYSGTATAAVGLVDKTGIDEIILNGQSVISQEVVFGDARGNTFVDNGFLQLVSADLEIGGATSFFAPGASSLGNAGALYFEFVGLTGVLNLDNSITFDAGVGTIKLYAELDSDLDSSTMSIELAAFDLIDPSGGAEKDFFGGAADDSVIAFTLVQASGIAGLFTDADDAILPFDLTLHLGNINAKLRPPIDASGLDGTGTGTVFITVDNSGQYNVARIPEPSSLAVLGFGLLALAGVVRRRRKQA